MLILDEYAVFNYIGNIQHDIDVSSSVSISFKKQLKPSNPVISLQKQLFPNPYQVF